MSAFPLQSESNSRIHPHDDPGDAPIRTIAFVSFWAGLLTATYLLRHLAGEIPLLNQQQTYLTALRPENPFRAAVSILATCPICQAKSGNSRGATPHD